MIKGFSIRCDIFIACACGYCNNRLTFLYGPHKIGKIMCRECGNIVGKILTGSDEHYSPIRFMFSPECGINVMVVP